MACVPMVVAADQITALCSVSHSELLIDSGSIYVKSRILVLAILLFLVLGAGSRCVIHSHDDDDTPPPQQQKAP